MGDVGIAQLIMRLLYKGEISLAPKHSHKSQMQQYASETSELGEEGQRAA